MFECLDITWLYPVYNATISCLGVVIVYGLKDKKPTRAKIAFAGIISLILAIIVLYTRNNVDDLMFAYK